MGGTVGWILVSWPFIFLLGAEADGRAGALDLPGRRDRLLRARRLQPDPAAHAAEAATPPAPTSWPGARRSSCWACRSWRVLFLVTFIDSVIHNGYFVMADGFLTNRVGIAGNL